MANVAEKQLLSHANLKWVLEFVLEDKQVELFFCFFEKEFDLAQELLQTCQVRDEVRDLLDPILRKHLLCLVLKILRITNQLFLAQVEVLHNLTHDFLIDRGPLVKCISHLAYFEEVD